MLIFSRGVANLVYGLLSFAISLILAWHLLLAANFFYGFWHDHIGIAENIAEVGPKNIYRSGFADTSRAERIDLFGQICEAITHQGKGLGDIGYTTANGSVTPLLHQAEIIHLQDVANLISTLQQGQPIVLALWLLVLGVFYGKSWRLPSYKQLLALNAIWLLSVGILIFSVGWVDVFYKLHVLIFPEGHQWFFYYQESLMSTMMKAPDLFLYIGVSLALVAVAIFAGLHRVLGLLQSKFRVQA